jgi:hypothetical protein
MAPETGTFTVPALAPGTYIMRIMEGFGPEAGATLVVG